MTDLVHVAHWGTYVTTPEITAEKASVAIETTLRNEHKSAKKTTIRQTILDADGKTVATTEDTLDLPAGAGQAFSQKLTVSKPKLWSPDEPNLYSVRTELFYGTRLVDIYQTPFGIRTILFDGQKGLFVNGMSTKMKGVCNHQDLDPPGSALWDQALERRMKMLKESGHSYPPSQ